MGRYLGDLAVGSTVTLKFSTSDGTTPSALVGGAIRCYKNGLLAECTTAPVLTADFDSLVGLNHVAIDTTLDAAFYAAGGDFTVVIGAGTVGGLDVAGTVIGVFSLQNRYAASGAPTAVEVAAAVWAYATRTLSSFGTLVADVAAALSGASITLASNVSAAGLLTLKQGDDYNASDSNSIDFTYTNTTYDPSSPTSLTLKIYFGSQQLAAWSGTVSGSASPWTLRFQPTAAQTAALNAGANYRYDIEVVKSARKRTIAEGLCVVNSN